ncbi:hypothetical protein FNV43_RR19042 [Rhamnella rubrinervis]|uniref:FHA domain-containing protein n=1 Tax=Rhamnella rubrinervis TaxID=2594499 RepID=A0A8K0GWL0_9ROSA|nr:hypothetical protein FNV43_RR19042 [Rhamnella rubrinervis]
MEAVASVIPWNPEDDLLLKNAVEAGASLEALAKGAVRFSRKFTVGELRDRWHSLLYDADVSAVASARMVEFGLSKSTGFGISKETVGVSAKRKVDSIRRQYYARRKRMCAFNSFDLSFLDPSNVNNGGVGGGDCEGELAVSSVVLDGNCMVGDHVGRYFEFPERGIGIVDHVPLLTTKDVVVSADTVGNTKNDFPRQENHPEIPSLLAKDSVEDDTEHNLKRNFAEKGLHSLEDNLVDYGNCAEGEDAGPSHVLSDIPLWKTIEDISAPEMPINDGLEDKGHNGEEELANPEDMDGNEMSASGYEVDHSQSIYEDKQVHNEVDRSTAISGGDFADISDSLLNLTNEEEHLFADVDGKDTVEKYCYDNVNPLLNSPKDDMYEDDVPDACQPQMLDSNTCNVVPGDMSTGEMGTNSEPFHSGDGGVISGDACRAEMGTTSNLVHSGDGNQQIMCCSEVNISSSKSVENPHILSSQSEENPHSPELFDEMMDCKLNSEDPEIPCNDDIHPFMFDYPVVQSRYIKASDPGCSSLNHKYNEQEIRSLKKEETLAHPFPAFQNTVPKINANHPLASCGVKRELSDGNCLVPVSKHDNNVPADPSSSRSGYGAPNSTANQVLKEEEINAALISTEPNSTNAAYMETEANSSALDEEESMKEFDDDNDIPNFSDVETMILEMDLSPDEDDSYVSKEVLRYQHEDTKRKIIRLEQCARSSMQRTIAHRNAFAILYGRHLKQYIKKTEVILGRATEENEVDIDLAKEGHANKISRRQALIKMEGDGSFFLKNIGKSSIFLNGKEVASGQLLSLCSNSLIEEDTLVLCNEGTGNVTDAVANQSAVVQLEQSDQPSLLLGGECKTYLGDIEVLKELKKGLDSNSVSPGSCVSSWDFTVDPCDNLFGKRFTCGFRCDFVDSGTSRVTELTLDQAGYAGSLASTYWNLPYLEILDVSGNFFSGSIPESLSNLTRLRRLALSGNKFSGEIPNSIGSLNNLEELYLDNNNLEGTIPVSLNGLVNLKRLELQSNKLVGEFPELGSLKNLYFLDASSNAISGELPNIFPTSLLQISIRNNSLGGNFPESIQHLVYLQVIDLSHNQLSGPVPSIIFDHPSLQQLTLSVNLFSFIQAPNSFGTRSELIALDISNNELRGLLPSFMAFMPKLSALSLENNKFTGMIPTQYAIKVVVPGTGVSPFVRLLLGGNYLFGVIPGPLMKMKPGSANVRLADNCLIRCPEIFFFCQGGGQKSSTECAVVSGRLSPCHRRAAVLWFVVRGRALVRRGSAAVGPFADLFVGRRSGLNRRPAAIGIGVSWGLCSWDRCSNLGGSGFCGIWALLWARGIDADG